ncbi:PLP-dependent aminotransferase family protein [Bacillus atrophaeus]|nr:PLP-dependent aminotransferase family protein [Bacillus atrophaeus]
MIRLTTNERLPIIENDAYGDLWFEEKPPFPIKSMDREGNVLYLGTLSKTVSPGLRIGWVTGPEPVIERLADIKMQTDYGSSALSQWAAAKWLSEGRYEEHLAWLRKELKARRDATLRFLQRYTVDIARWNVLAGSFYIWVTFHRPLPVRRLLNQALTKNVLLNPGSVYDPDDRQSLRLSYSYAALPDIEKSIKVLAETARQLRSEHTK